MTILSVHTKEYYGLNKSLPMTKIYVAPRIKEDHSFVKQDEWASFNEIPRKKKLYRLHDLVKHFNHTIRPYKQLKNRGFLKISKSG